MQTRGSWDWQGRKTTPPVTGPWQGLGSWRGVKVALEIQMFIWPSSVRCDAELSYSCGHRQTACQLNTSLNCPRHYKDCDVSLGSYMQMRRCLQDIDLEKYWRVSKQWEWASKWNMYLSPKIVILYLLFYLNCNHFNHF